MTGDAALRLHASCVAAEGRGLLILGPSGAGKSSLALQMIALGAGLVADDQVELFLDGGALFARGPARLAGLVEARGIGLLHVPPVAKAPVRLAVDLGQLGVARLPERHEIVLLGQRIDLVKSGLNAHLAAALLVYLRGARLA